MSDIYDLTKSVQFQTPKTEIAKDLLKGVEGQMVSTEVDLVHMTTQLIGTTNEQNIEFLKKEIDKGKKTIAGLVSLHRTLLGIIKDYQKAEKGN